MEKTNILIIGSGGREHALGWKLSQSQSVDKIFYCPGNGGTQNNLQYPLSDFSNIGFFAKNNNCLVVVGPEEPLTRGIVNELSDKVDIFGPSKEAAQLESSKSFAKKFMKQNDIATSNFSIFNDAEKAKDYVYKSSNELVIKADGLAAGKGVFVCDNKEDGIDAINSIMINKTFGIAGNTIVIEDRIYGDEVSFIGITDGETIIPMATSQDHKRIYENDKGPNTGGMGSFSPSKIISNDQIDDIMSNIMKKTINSMKNNRNKFKGFLYAGLMIEKETHKPYVLEFNARMGDPECQPIMMRMNSDLFDYINCSINGTLDTLPPIEWNKNPAVCVVMAEKGYPSKYEIGNIIKGLNSDFGQNVMIFHAGTKKKEDNDIKQILTSGGRVLGVTALGKDFPNAITNVYEAVNKISWGANNQYYRRDIGTKEYDNIKKNIS
ncbi:MAG TPA: phosphoribosylamine--glycine ligase [Nitrososphaeraceae archaeon]|nr:phosphoribosylamine--glycine ligase [Nitrososphaeraceae archaeon]